MQHWVSRRRETSLEMRDLQLQANPCNACVITRNWSRTAVRVRSVALYFARKTPKKQSPMLASGALSADVVLSVAKFASVPLERRGSVHSCSQ